MGSWVQYGWDVGSRVEFRVNRTREGTFPLGSEWTMNPIPVCNSTAMGWLDPSCPQGWEFPPRAPGLHGTGEDVSRPGQPSFDWTLMDEVEVPADRSWRLRLAVPMGLRGHPTNLEQL